jgi:hypothetical protein
MLVFLCTIFFVDFFTTFANFVLVAKERYKTALKLSVANKIS